MTRQAVAAPGTSLTRRGVLVRLAAAGLGGLALAVQAAEHAPFGFERPPRALPGSLRLIGPRARPQPIAAWLAARCTAVQLVYTGCSSVCPLQGATFAALQGRLDGAAGRGMQLLSLSIDPLHDDAAALDAWLARFGARTDRWRAAVVAPPDLAGLLDFLGARRRAGGAGADDGLDRHGSATYVFDRAARLVFRSDELADASGLAEVMREVAAA